MFPSVELSLMGKDLKLWEQEGVGLETRGLNLLIITVSTLVYESALICQVLQGWGSSNLLVRSSEREGVGLAISDTILAA
jgi:hypothetical protein